MGYNIAMLFVSRTSDCVDLYSYVACCYDSAYCLHYMLIEGKSNQSATVGDAKLTASCYLVLMHGSRRAEQQCYMWSVANMLGSVAILMVTANINFHFMPTGESRQLRPPLEVLLGDLVTK